MTGKTRRPPPSGGKGGAAKGERPASSWPKGVKPRYELSKGAAFQEEKPAGGRPRPDKPHGDRPRGDKPFGQRPKGTQVKGAPGRGESARGERTKLFHVSGLPSVAALFARTPERVERLAYDARHEAAAAAFIRQMQAQRRPCRLVPTAELDRIAGTQLHGGIVALVKPRPLLDFDVGEAKRWAREGKPLLILDGVSNPHNLGAIVRSAAFFGLGHIVISDHPQQAGPSEAAWRVSEGGLEQVQVHRAHNLPHVLPRLAPEWLVLATALERGRPLPQVRPGRPVALVLGNEEEGLGEATLKACAEVVTIPGSGAVQSLNVAATAAILIHHFLK